MLVQTQAPVTAKDTLLTGTAGVPIVHKALRRMTVNPMLAQFVHEQGHFGFTAVSVTRRANGKGIDFQRI